MHPRRKHARRPNTRRQIIEASENHNHKQYGTQFHRVNLISSNGRPQPARLPKIVSTYPKSGLPARTAKSASIRVPHLRDGFIVAKVDIRAEARTLPTQPPPSKSAKADPPATPTPSTPRHSPAHNRKAHSSVHPESAAPAAAAPLPPTPPAAQQKSPLPRSPSHKPRESSPLPVPSPESACQTAAPPTSLIPVVRLQRSAPTPPSPQRSGSRAKISSLNSACRRNRRRMHNRIQLLHATTLQTQSAPAPPDPAAHRPSPRHAPKWATIAAYTACPGSINSRPIASADNTCAPCPANSRAAVDFPLPSPPVKPTRSIAFSPCPQQARAAALPPSPCSASASQSSARPRLREQAYTPPQPQTPPDEYPPPPPTRAWQT